MPFLLTETSLFYPKEENMVLHTISQCFLESQYSSTAQSRLLLLPLLPLPYHPPSSSPHFTQILNRKVSLGDTTGDTNVMGATQANTKGVGTSSWQHPGGSHFSPQGQLDPERDSLYPSGGQHATTPVTQSATASDAD